MSVERAVFFDLHGTLGFERAAWNGERLVRYTPRREIPELLAHLRQRARLGVLVFDDGLERERVVRALAASRLLGSLDPSLVVVGRGGDEGAFARAVAAADLVGSPERAVYVGLDATHRLRAARAGLRVAPHPILAQAALDGERLHYVRASVPAGALERGWAPLLRGAIVPVLVTQESDPALYAIAAESAIESLRGLVPSLDSLGTPSDPIETSLYLIQVTPEQFRASSALKGFLTDLRGQLSLVQPTPSGWLVAVPGSRSIDELHPPDTGHGHARMLVPGPAALQEPGHAGGFALAALDSSETTVLDQLDAALYGAYFEPCCGLRPLPTANGDVWVTSRHVKHVQNSEATDGFAAALAQICGTDRAFKVPFGLLDGKVLYNVEAEIPGTSPELLVVGAHLDSTAANTYGYPGNEHVRAAPGADDDASGVAGVLAVAQVLETLSQAAPPRRTIRFVLFNAEEQGMVGSRIYADSLKSAGVPVAAMFQMDMIGWVSGSHPGGVFEIHGTGADNYTSVYAACRQLTAVVVGAAAQVSPDLVPQTYPLEGCSTDPAAHRSDHDSFQYQGWPACLVSEDLWADGCASPAQLGNPNYHQVSDVGVDAKYAADVARAVAAAAWMVANSSSASPSVAPESPASPAPSASSGIRVPAAAEASTTADPGSLPIPEDGGPPMSDTDPTPEKYLVEFLAKWIRDEDFRCAILKRELSELQAYGLTEPQINDLLTLDKQTIVGRILKEFEHDLGIDLPRVKSEVHGVEITPLPPGAGSPSPVNPGGGSELILPVRRPRLPGLGSASVRRAMAAVGASSTAGVVEAAYATTVAFLMSAATVYAEGQVHIRGVTPPTLSQGDDRILVIRGQGFDEASKIQVRFRKGPKHKNADVLGVTCDVDVYQRVTVRVTLDELGEWAVQARNQGESVWSTEDVSVVVI